MNRKRHYADGATRAAMLGLIIFFSMDENGFKDNQTQLVYDLEIIQAWA